MYEKLSATVHQAMADANVAEAFGAMVYKDGDEFSYIPLSEAPEDRGNEFIKIVMHPEMGSPHWLPWCREAIQYQSYISGLINDEIIEIDKEQ